MLGEPDWQQKMVLHLGFCFIWLGVAKLHGITLIKTILCLSHDIERYVLDNNHGCNKPNNWKYREHHVTAKI